MLFFKPQSIAKEVWELWAFIEDILQAMDKTCIDIIEKKTFTDAYKCCMNVQSVVAFNRPGDWQSPCGIKPKTVSCLSSVR